VHPDNAKTIEDGLLVEWCPRPTRTARAVQVNRKKHSSAASRTRAIQVLVQVRVFPLFVACRAITVGRWSEEAQRVVFPRQGALNNDQTIPHSIDGRRSSTFVPNSRGNHSSSVPAQTHVIERVSRHSHPVPLHSRNSARSAGWSPPRGDTQNCWAYCDLSQAATHKSAKP